MQRGRVRVLEGVDLPRGRVTHQPRRVDDGGVLRCGERHADHLDPPLRQLLVEVRRREVGPRRQRLAAGELSGEPHARGAVDVDVEVRVVVRALQDRVRVRAAARLHGGHLYRRASFEMSKMRTPWKPLPTGRALRPAVDPTARLLDRHEEQVPVDRHLALPARADDGGDDRRSVGIGDVVDLEAVEVADVGPISLQREVGVDEGKAARVRRIEEAGGLVLRARAARGRSRPPPRCRVRGSARYVGPGRPPRRRPRSAALPRGGRLAGRGSCSSHLLGRSWRLVTLISRRGRYQTRSVLRGRRRGGARGCSGSDEPETVGETAPNIVQPGAPGRPSRTLSPEELEEIEQTPHTKADVAFMKGMIHHHAQALHMTALVPKRSTNRATSSCWRSASTSRRRPRSSR